MQEMQDMFLSKFKKLKLKNKVLFNKAMKESGLPGRQEFEMTYSSPDKEIEDTDE